MKKQKCLLILPRSVFPTVCGYAIKNKNVIELLNDTYDLTLVVMKEKAFTEEEKDYYKKHSKRHCLWVRPRFKSCIGALCAILSGQPLQVGYYYDKGLQERIDHYLASCQIAVAVLDRTIQYLANANEKTVRIFDIIDSISLNYQRSKEHTSSLFWKILYTFEGKRLLKFEGDWIEKADATYFINQNECNYWRSRGNACWLPHGVKPEIFTYQKTDPTYKTSVAFIGKMDYQPNVDAMIWYIKNVHSVIGEQVPLYIVGAFPAKELNQLAASCKNITITGYMDDPYLILNSAMAMIAPMQTGGGIQNKVLEGMAMGKINIVTTLAAKPISGASAGKHFLIADTPEEYIDYLLKIRRNPQKYAFIGENARKHIMDNFTWAAHNRQYLNEIRNIQKRSQSCPPVCGNADAEK